MIDDESGLYCALKECPQQTNGAGAEDTLPPRCLITGCCDDAEPTSVFCAWHNIGLKGGEK